MAVKAPPVVPPLPVFSWTGFYVGVNARIGGDKVDYSLLSPLTVPPASANVNNTSFGGLAGGQIGYNWQTSNWVWGVEADIQWTNIGSKLNASASNVLGVPNASLNASTEMSYFGTVRGRLGYAWDRTLLYATGGYAYGSEDTRLVTTPALVNFSRSHSLNGWTVGGGLEWSPLNNISLKTEYLFTQFDRSNVFADPALFTIDNKVTSHMLRFGVNYRFGPWGATY
jgi:outer membrane immunogenic protein